MAHKMEALPPHIIIPPDSEMRRIDLPPVRNCITCGGRGSFRWYATNGWTRTDEIVEWECDCTQQYILAAYLMSRGIDLRASQKGWSDLVGVPAETRAVIDDYLSNAHSYADRGVGMALLGDTGTGKSLVASLMLRRLMHDGFDGCQIMVTDFISAFRRGWSDTDDRDHFDHRVKQAGVLVIDEIGKEHLPERPTTGPSDLMDSVLRSRYGALRPTFFTSNFSLSDLGIRYGSMLIDIINGSSVTLKMHGVSWRDDEKALSERERALGLTRPIVWG